MTGCNGGPDGGFWEGEGGREFEHEWSALIIGGIHVGELGGTMM